MSSERIVSSRALGERTESTGCPVKDCSDAVDAWVKGLHMRSFPESCQSAAKPWGVAALSSMCPSLLSQCSTAAPKLRVHGLSGVETVDDPVVAMDGPVTQEFGRVTSDPYDPPAFFCGPDEASRDTSGSSQARSDCVLGEVETAVRKRWLSASGRQKRQRRKNVARDESRESPASRSPPWMDPFEAWKRREPAPVHKSSVPLRRCGARRGPHRAARDSTSSPTCLLNGSIDEVRRSMNQTSALRTCDRLHVPMDTAGRDSERFDRDRCRSSPYARSRRGTPRLTSHFSQTIHNPSHCDTSSPVTSKTPVLSWCSCVCVAQAQDSCLFHVSRHAIGTDTAESLSDERQGLLNRRSIESLETCTAAIGAQSVSCASRRQSEISQAGDRRRSVIAEQTRWKVPDIWSDTLLGAKERQGAFDRTARSDALEAPCSSPETLTAMSASIASDHGRAASGSPPFSTFDWDDVGLENPMSDACSSSIDTLCSPLASKGDCGDVETGGIEGEIECLTLARDGVCSRRALGARALGSRTNPETIGVLREDASQKRGICPLAGKIDHGVNGEVMEVFGDSVCDAQTTRLGATGDARARFGRPLTTPLRNWQSFRQSLCTQLAAEAATAPNISGFSAAESRSVQPMASTGPPAWTHQVCVVPETEITEGTPPVDSVDEAAFVTREKVQISRPMVREDEAILELISTSDELWTFLVHLARLRVLVRDRAHAKEEN